MDPTKDSRIPENTPHLYSERFLTPSGKARFFGVEYKPVNTGGKKFILVTGRSVLRYNTDNEIRRISGKFETSIAINPEDAKALGIHNGQLVKLVSNCGEGVFKALISNDVPRGRGLRIHA
ncbi:molybdopterin dinucleotide binding domain-containing protein [Vulcanisaeta distributa]|uniref:molybdopterin dinucleotide binding domain-containing protein n=1 Tax=Vulcanisaeta distributa TaxID=164451 RepID=UPI001FB42432|nr:molybdopterin dinucleotide binding domain-containing protein [Vulcanisaeta distributa]